MIFDWQAYADSSLTTDEMVLHELALREDPRAAAELQSMLALKAAIRDAGFSDHIPTDRLHGLLVKAARPKFGLKQSMLAAACLVAILAAGAVISRQAGNPDFAQSSSTVATGPAHAAAQQLLINDPYQAQHWVTSQTHYVAPVMRKVCSKCKLLRAEVGDGSFGYTFSQNGVTYHLVAQMEAPVDRCLPESHDGLPYLVSSNKVMWRCQGNLYYTLQGGSPASRMQIAVLARQDTPNATF